MDDIAPGEQIPKPTEDVVMKDREDDEVVDQHEKLEKELGDEATLEAEAEAPMSESGCSPS